MGVSLGEWRSGRSVAAGISLTGGFAAGIVRVEDRSVFEKGLGREELPFEPEATTSEGGVAPMAGGDDAEGFTEVAERLMEAKPLELVRGT